MKLKFFWGGLACFMASIACTPLAAAMEIGPELETVTVTATKTEKQVDGVVASVQVVTEEEIRSMGANDLKEVLEKTPGLTIQYGSATSASKGSVTIRGMGTSGTLFLLDGRRMSGEVENTYTLDRIPAGMIERIEIVRGPMSVLYGADATGGLINIITKKPESGFGGSIAAQGGVNTDGDGSKLSSSFSLQGKADKFGYSLYLDALKTGPYTEREPTTTLVKTPNGLVSPSAHPNPAVHQIQDSYNVDVAYREDSEVYTIGGRSTYDLLDSTVLGVDFSYFTEDREGDYRAAFFPTAFGAPAFDTPVHSSDENWRRDLGMDLRSHLTDNLTLHLKAYNSFYKKRNTTTALNWQDAGFASQDASENSSLKADVDIWSYEGFGLYALGENHLLTVGGEYRDEERKGTPFSLTGDFVTREVTYRAAYLQDEWQITDSLNVTFGGRYDDISSAEDKFTFKLGLVNRFSDLYVLRGNFAQGYRAPDIRELYIFKNTPIGAQRGANVLDPALGKTPLELEPEFVNSYELGLSGRQGGFSYKATVFYNDISDKIELVTKNPGTPQAFLTYENISDATTMGLELAAGHRFASGIGLDLSWFELNTEDDETGRDLEFNPERQVSATLSYNTDRFEIWTMGKHVGEQSAPEADDGEVGSYTLVDVGTSYAFSSRKQYEIFGGINNLLDKRVSPLLGSNVGPFVYAGIRANF